MKGDIAKFSDYFPHDPVVHDINESLISDKHQLCGNTRRHIKWEIVSRIETMLPKKDQATLESSARQCSRDIDAALSYRKIGLSEFPKPKCYSELTDPFLKPSFQRIVGWQCWPLILKKKPDKGDVARLDARVVTILNRALDIGYEKYTQELMYQEGRGSGRYYHEIKGDLETGEGVMHLICCAEHLKIRCASSQKELKDSGAAINSCIPAKGSQSRISACLRRLAGLVRRG